MTAQYKLIKRLEKGMHVCVGLDTDINKIPRYLLNSKNPVLEFNKIIIENTFEHAAAYKINFAFYEAEGSKGFDNILETLNYIYDKNILTIGDAKRGDIGNTSQMYAKSIYDYLKFDSVTLHPYMGFDSIEPFLSYTDKINFILALTSNPGSKDFEKQKLQNGLYLYQQIIKSVSQWDTRKNCGLVFGATNPSELEENIALIGDMPILLPGVGSQGGDLETIVKILKKTGKNNFLINVSRALIYCDSTPDFGKQVGNVIKSLDETISKIL